jgi:hypothetical protein
LALAGFWWCERFCTDCTAFNRHCRLTPPEKGSGRAGFASNVGGVNSPLAQRSQPVTLRTRSGSFKRRRMRRHCTMKFISVLMSLPLSGAALGSRPACAQGATDVAFVEDMNGRVIASSQQGRPFLLQTLDTINDRTHLDILANGEVRICHYQTRRILILTGPLRVSVSRDGVTAENGKAPLVSAESCSMPLPSTFQGGVISRGSKGPGQAPAPP